MNTQTQVKSRKRRPRPLLLALLFFGMFIFALGCEEPGPQNIEGRDTILVEISDTQEVDTDPPPIPELFDDHTLLGLENIQDFDNLKSDGARTSLKFVLVPFRENGAQNVVYMDSNFYELHDEWFWFRLLNGARIPGVEEVDPLPGVFETIQEIYDWAERQKTLPLELRFTRDGRLYSSYFYDLALKDPRRIGLGKIIYFEAYADETFQRDEVWVFELEYADEVTHEELVHFFDALDATLPPVIGSALQWVIRSPVQEELAALMEREQLLYHDRILRYEQLIIPGATEVYSEGLTAGRLRIAEDSTALEESTSSDILVLPDVPDWLPACAALITAIPQTPLAHISVLARNRGIPNVHRAGVLEDPALSQLARARAPVLIQAKAPDQVDLIAISEEEFRTWQALGTSPRISVPQVDMGSIEEILKLSDLDINDLESWRPVIGGKASGILPLLEQPGIETPDHPIAISIRPYFEHISPLKGSIDAMLIDQEFVSSSKVRLLLLEGRDRFLASHQTAEDSAWLDDYLQSHPLGDPLGDLVRAEGLVQKIRDLPIDPGTMQRLRAALTVQFESFSLAQGLRFRSSSTVEDIEGFSGAGLYDSNTGFLDPSLQTNSKDRTKTISWALKKTWSSYWGFEAFEERRLEGIEHLSGNMAVLVHARFDDPKEVTNGVLTLTQYPEGFEIRAKMQLNVQLGDVSVTNPESNLGALPEVDEVSLLADGTLQIDRLRASSLTGEGNWLLDDAKLTDLFEQTHLVTQAWLDRNNAPFAPAEAGRTLTLDFEFREMAAGWPALVEGSISQRMIIKQARSLEPGLLHLPTTLTGLPFPRDILARTRRGERIVCQSEIFSLVTAEIYTDELLPPDLGYSHAPFSAFVSLEVLRALPSLEVSTGARLLLSHDKMHFDHPGMDDGGPWSLSIEVLEGSAPSTNIVGFNISADGTCTLLGRNGAFVEGACECDHEVTFASPEDFLLSIVERKNK